MERARAIVTGSAGFIGSHIAEALLKEYDVTGLDNFSSGRLKLVPTINEDLVSGDTASYFNYFKDTDVVFHFAANPDVKIGAENTRIHLEQNVIATYNVLEAMRKTGVPKIVFASSSTVYGNAKKMPTPEDYAPLEPVSLYGASKFACEALITSYCHTFGMQAWMFRLANIIGPRSNHGIIPDFIKKLKNNPGELEILGNGEQCKSYLYIDDCVNAILDGFRNSHEKVNILNIGSADKIKVKDIADIVSEEMNLMPRYKFTGGMEGWKGDVPVMLLDISKIRLLGWQPEYCSKSAVKKTVSELIGAQKSSNTL